MSKERTVVVVSQLKYLMAVLSLLGMIAGATAYAFTTFETKAHSQAMNTLLREDLRKLGDKLDQIGKQLYRLEGYLKSSRDARTPKRNRSVIGSG